MVALSWRGRLSSARMEPITTSKQLLLLEAIGRVRNDVNAQHISFGSAMCFRLIKMLKKSLGYRKYRDREIKDSPELQE
jgi:hypothetical protein